MVESMNTPESGKYYTVKKRSEMPSEGKMVLEGRPATYTTRPNGVLDIVFTGPGAERSRTLSPNGLDHAIKNTRVEIPEEARIADATEEPTLDFDDLGEDTTESTEAGSESGTESLPSPEEVEREFDDRMSASVAAAEKALELIRAAGGKVPEEAEKKPKKEAEKLPEMNLDQAKATFLGKTVEFRNTEASDRAKTLYETNAKEAAKIKVVSKEKVVEVIEKDGEILLVSETGLKMPVSAMLARSVEALARANKLDGLKEKFLTGMRKDTAKENMGGLKKTWLGIKSAFNIGDSNKMVGGLSKETSEAWGELNGYLDELRASAATEWQERRTERGLPPLTDEELKELDRRYVARFMGGLQLQSEYEAMHAEKAERTSTWAQNAVAKAKKWWGSVHPGVKMGLGVAAAAGVGLATGGVGAAAMGAAMAGGGMGLSALFNKTVRGKGKTIEAWTGFGASQSMSLGSRVMYGLSGGGSFNLGAAGIVSLSAALVRTGLETYSTTKGDAETMKKISGELKSFNDKVKNLNEAMDTIEKTLKSPEAIKASGQTKEQLENRLRKYETELVEARNQITLVEKNFKQAAGRLDNKLKEYTEQYNSGKITASKYIEYMEAARGRDELMETLKQSMTLVALGSVAGRIGDHFIGGDDTIVAPENESTPNDDEAGPKPLPGPVQPEEHGPDQVPTPEAATHEPREVQASSRGAIDTIRQLQAQYTDETMPEALKGDPTKLAIKYDFYNPQDTNESAMIYKGETLGINEKGELYYTHKDGTTEIIGDSKGNVVTDKTGEGWDGKYFDYGGSQADSSTVLHPDDSTVLHPDDSTVLHPKDDPSTVLHPEKTPEEIAAEEARQKMQTKIVSFVDNFDDGLKEKLYDQAMGMQAQVLMDNSGFAPDINDKFWPLRDQLMEIQKETGLNPEPYESVEQYMNRVLAASGATYTVEAIHQDKVFSDVTVNPEEFEDMRFRESYKAFMDKFFDKPGPALTMESDWKLEGTTNVYYSDIKDLPARDVFQGIESGKVGPDDIAQRLNVSPAAGARLFDFFQETKKLVETNLGQFHVDGKMTINDVLQDALRKKN